MQLDPGRHSAAVWGGHLKDHFKTEEHKNVKADVDLVIFAKEEPDVEAPWSKRAKLASSSTAAAAASAAGNCASAGCLQELTRFPAHNIILNGAGYFSAQQVRGSLWCCAALLDLQHCIMSCVALPVTHSAPTTYPLSPHLLPNRPQPPPPRQIA
jgi:hypothetical protein